MISLYVIEKFHLDIRCVTLPGVLNTLIEEEDDEEENKQNKT